MLVRTPTPLPHFHKFLMAGFEGAVSEVFPAFGRHAEVTELLPPLLLLPLLPSEVKGAVVDDC